MNAASPSIEWHLLGLLAVAACGSSVERQGASPGDAGAGDALADVVGTVDAGASSPDASGTMDARTPVDGGGESDGSDAGAPALGAFMAGTNLSGAEFGAAPGVYGTNYIYPPHSDVDYFVGKGFRVFRIPFLWERMQPTLGQPLDSTELGRLTDLVSYATSQGAHVLIDPHNYARYKGQVIGATGSAVTAANFAAFWSQLAAAFSANPLVVFGLMNEPHDMATELWLADANAAIAAIRSAGATNVIFVPGNGWTGAHSWTQSSYGTPDSTVMLGVADPLHNYVFEVHQYLDADSSGTSATCASTTIGSQSLVDFTSWLQKNHLRGFLGEFGAANNPTCLSALTDMLSAIDQHHDLWVGWTWWSAGPWWGSYMYSIEPANGVDAPQLATLEQHL